MSADDQSVADALQSALAGEHAAVWTFALLGARTSQSAQPTLSAAVRSGYDAHQQTRDDLIATIAGRGPTPVAAAPAYQPPAGLDTVAGIEAAALALEQASLRSYVALLAATTGELRRSAIGWLDDTAARALGFGGTPETFPGAAELADR